MSRRILVLVGLFLLPRFAVAGYVTATALPDGQGNTDYSYTLSNGGATPLISFMIDAFAPGQIQSPAGWDYSLVELGDQTTITWIPEDFGSSSIAPGASLSGFGYESSGSLGTVDWLIFDDSFNSTSGETVGAIASVVPEPSALITFGVGGLFVLSYAWVFRREAQDGKRGRN
jgi:hypothetical protein